MNEQAYFEKSKLLSGMGMLLQSCTREKELFDVTQLYLKKLFPEFRSEIFLQDESGGTIAPVFNCEKSEKITATPDFDHCEAFIRGVLINGHEKKSNTCAECTWGECCIPFCQGRETFGLLCLSGGPEKILARDRGLAFILAEYLALTISNLRLRKQLHELTIKDPLTGLYNRRHMDEIIHREIKRAQRTQTKFGIIMLDLDHFKQINDTFGHDAGDEVLKNIAGVLNSMFRFEDVACRFGGEEFLVLLTSGEPEIFSRRAEELKNKIKSLEITWENNLITPVTASLGVAVFPDHAHNFKTLFRVADQALYTAKETGRDRIVTAGNEKNITMKIKIHKKPVWGTK